MHRICIPEGAILSATHEEIDILYPILMEEPNDAARITEVTPRTEVCIKASFQSMPNSARRSLRSKFILPKVAATIAPCLEKVYGRAPNRQTGLWRGSRLSRLMLWDH